MTGGRPAAPRGRCAWCGRIFAITKAGGLWRHVARPEVSGALCLGSGTAPLSDQAAALLADLGAGAARVLDGPPP